ncbi:unnamed protein product [Lactuca saligna]|uniref:HXXXD-type acyl-transferase family protein n=1 Tax=Lactuca saligna TaxID=75948 RepID=A0AA35ZHP7_LACSI|nr:unnamed protein product [Lactuca saligna]
MSYTSVKRVSECLIKPLQDLSPEAKQPLHLTPLELFALNVNYSQKGLLFPKPPPSENQDFSITAYLDDLRYSLSATLDHFYLLAGRLATKIEENPPSYVIYLDCENSPGVKFIYATVDATISDILQPGDVPVVVRSFFDLNNAISYDGHTLPLLSIQVTELVDGIFIGGSINHVLADAASFWHFMGAWSEIFKSKEKSFVSISRPPVLKRWVLPGYDPIISLPYTHHDQFIERLEAPPLVERFFHFSSASVSKLKAKANSECNTDKLSSLQAVIALLWRCITRARRLSDDDETSSNLMGTATVRELMTNGLGWAAFRLHEAVMNYTDTTVKENIESWIKNPFIFKRSKMNAKNHIIVLSSPRLDMYGCEFGLGKALAVRSGWMNKDDGTITMYPGREGGGSMDVEVCFASSQTMMDLNSDEEFMDALI